MQWLIFAELSKRRKIWEIYFPRKLPRNLYKADTWFWRTISSGNVGVAVDRFGCICNEDQLFITRTTVQQSLLEANFLVRVQHCSQIFRHFQKIQLIARTWNIFYLPVQMLYHGSKLHEKFYLSAIFLKCFSLCL